MSVLKTRCGRMVRDRVPPAEFWRYITQLDRIAPEAFALPERLAKCVLCGEFKMMGNVGPCYACQARAILAGRA